MQKRIGALTSLTLALGATLTMPMLASAAAPGSISGTVIDESTETGIVGINVQLFSEDRQGQVARVASVTTDADGDYEFPDVASGTYFVSYSAWNTYVTEYYKDSPTLQGAEPVVVAGEAVEGIDEALAVGGDVNGTVTGAGGAALAGVKVNIYEFLPRAGWVLHRETKTGADGTYSAKKIPAGAYRVGFVDEDHGHLPAFHGGASMKEAEDVLLTKGGEVEVDAKLTMGSVVNGRVSDQLGEFAGDVTVTLYRQGPAGTWGETRTASTGARGAYRFDTLAPGTYRVGFNDKWGRFVPEFHTNAPTLEKATDITVGKEGTVSVDADLDWFSSVTGAVSDSAGKPVAGVAVTAYGADGSPAATATTDAEGAYTLGRLRAGTYKLEFKDASGKFVTGHSSVKVEADTSVAQDVKLLTPAESAPVPTATPTPTPTATPTPTVPVETEVSVSKKPKLKGKAKVGKTLRVTRGQWSTETVKLRYVWLVNGKKLTGAEGRTLKVTGKLRGKRISVRVVATAPGLDRAVVKTAATPKVTR